MAKGIRVATAKLKQDPKRLEQLTVEPHCEGRRSAGDLFREIEPIDNESAEEMRRAIRESREEARKRAASKEPPVF